MALNDVTHTHSLFKVMNVLVFVAQNCISLFLPLYLKYIGLSVLEMSLIRAFQVIVNIIVVPVSINIMKLKNCGLWRAHFVCFSLLGSFGACAVLAVYFQSGTNVSLMHCGVGKHSKLRDVNIYVSRNVTTFSKTAHSVPSAVSDVDSIVSFQDDSTSTFNLDTTTIAEEPTRITESVSVSDVNLDLELQLPEILNSTVRGVGNSRIKNGKPYDTNWDSTYTSVELPTTQAFKILSSPPVLKQQLTRPTDSFESTEVNYLIETYASENVEDIFSATEKSVEQISHQKNDKNHITVDTQEYSQEIKDDFSSQLQSKAEVNVKPSHKIKAKPFTNAPLLVNSYSHKHFSKMQGALLAKQGSLNLHIPNYLRKTALGNRQFVPKAETNDRDMYATNPTPPISTAELDVTPQISLNFAARHLKKIMDFWEHHKPHTHMEHKYFSNYNMVDRQFQNSDIKKTATPNTRVHQYSKINPVSSYGYVKKFAKANTGIVQQHIKHRIKRKVSGAELLEVLKKMPLGQPIQHGNDIGVISQKIIGTRKPMQQSAESQFLEAATAGNYVEAVPVSTKWGYHDISEMFVGAAVLVAVFEVLTSVILPCVQELWQQTLGQQHQARSPLQLGAWSACACLVLPLALSQQCHLRATVHCGSAGALFVLALLPALVALPPVVRRAQPNKATLGLENDMATGKQLAYVRPVAKLVSGFLSACSGEFMLWHVASLEGFPLDYEVLFCGYVSLSALTEGAVRSCYREQECGGSWLLGCALLGTHSLLASMLGHPWAALAVAPLDGASSALLRPTHSTGWTLGYSLGCIVGGVLASSSSTAYIFQLSAAASCIWCMLIIVCRGMLSCRRSHSYMHLLSTPDDSSHSYMHLLLTPDDCEESDNTDSPADCEDWLEKAMMEEEQLNK